MLTLAIKDYLADHQRPLSKALEEIQKHAYDHCEGSQMICGAQLVSLISILIKLMKAKKTLDIGTYVGFSALAIAEALDDDGTVQSCERDERHFKVAKANVASHPEGKKVSLHLQDAKEFLNTIDYPVDFSFLDADKAPYIDYYEMLVEKTRPGGIILADDALWKGMVAEPNTPRLHLMNEFNEHVKKDIRVENILIPVRHGVNLIYKH